MRITCVFVLAAAGCAAPKPIVAECSCEQEVADAKAEEAKRRVAVEGEKEQVLTKNAELESSNAALASEVAELKAHVASLERFPDHAAVAKQLDALKVEKKRLEQAQDELDEKMPAVQDERAKLLEEKAALEAQLGATKAGKQH